MSHIIYIQEYLPSIIATRSSINSFKERSAFKTGDSYIFDFSNIVFISRSFTDEFLKYLKSSNIQWRIKNANQNINAMFSVVSHSQKSSQKDYDKVAITSFKTDSDLMNFLATI
jgi:hypothetical protein